MVLHWVVGLLLASSGMAQVVASVPPAGAQPAQVPQPVAAPQAAPQAPGAPAWVGKPVRASHWVTLEGEKGKKFLVNSDEFDAFKSGPEAAAPIALYEGEIPASGWMPSWEAVKNFAIWSTAAELKLSEYRLEKLKGGGVAYDAVKGEERVAVVEAGRGGRTTVATVTISKPAAAPSPAPAAPAPAAARPPVAATPPHQVAETPRPVTNGDAPATNSASDPIQKAADMLFPVDPSGSRLLAAMIRQKETQQPGAAQAFINSVNAAAEGAGLSPLLNEWKGKMREACSGRILNGAALEQARALAQRMAGEGDSAEAAHADTQFDQTAGPLDEQCRAWGGTSEPTGEIESAMSRLGVREPYRVTAVNSPAPLPPPPAPAVTAKQTAPDAPAKKKGASAGGIFKFLAVLAGAALGAVAGSFFGPTMGLVGMAVGAGLGFWASGKASAGDKGPKE